MKIFSFNVKGIITKKEMEELFLEINNCEFCNNGIFNLNLKEFYYNEEEDLGVGIVEVYCDEKIKIQEKLGEMINCEFCHDEIDYICCTEVS